MVLLDNSLWRGLEFTCAKECERCLRGRLAEGGESQLRSYQQIIFHLIALRALSITFIIQYLENFTCNITPALLAPKLRVPAQVT